MNIAKQKLRMRTSKWSANVVAIILLLGICANAGLSSGSQSRTTEVIQNEHLVLKISTNTGEYRILDKKSGVIWRSNPEIKRFGRAALIVDGEHREIELSVCQAHKEGGNVLLEFPVGTNEITKYVGISINIAEERPVLEMKVEVGDGIEIRNVRILDNALWTDSDNKGCVYVPVREGLMVPAWRGGEFTRGFGTYDYEGCHMRMIGIDKGDASALVTWNNPYTRVALERRYFDEAKTSENRYLMPSLIIQKPEETVRIEFCKDAGIKGVARAYRGVAKNEGFMTKWDEKVERNADAARLFGAVNFKLWSMLTRRMNESSTEEIYARVNWTFDEAVEIARHLKNDLELEKVLFIIGGWINRGYDNQHPDIMPAAPECGGNDGLGKLAREIERLGYLFCLHDNYQDMYRDSPSWDEEFIMKNRDGSLKTGGRWAGGRAYLTCSKKAVELARRPQNLPAVNDLTDADAYFIDTTYAAGLYECFDPEHPLTKGDDMKWKQEISDYARDTFGMFGSECGREWGIPHSEFFEGLGGVSGRYYHDAELLGSMDAIPVPLFEAVYRDTIAVYGKYGYEIGDAADYVLHHLSIGRTLHHHNIPAGLYWKEGDRIDLSGQIEPAGMTVEPMDGRRFRVFYNWDVNGEVTGQWTVFVHYTDSAGEIVFQDDHQPAASVSDWEKGVYRDGPYVLQLPEGVEDELDVRIGLFGKDSGARARLAGNDDGNRRYVLGQIGMADGGIEFKPAAAADVDWRDPALFVNGHNGWAAGLCPLDRFIKNTYELLSPLNEITANMRMTEFEFLDDEFSIRKSVFGSGEDAVEVVVNMSESEYTHTFPRAGDAILPAYGFFVDAPGFIAFNAKRWNGVEYDNPVLFTLRSLDARPLAESRRIRVFHGFGDSLLRFNGATYHVERESVISP
ncbi:MAG: DUF6259 domain-containing protein [Verrucomicrobia bacterium]|nr:DUF6259 domain-containing protein [Verrucomicrobiota bacterium]